MTRLPAIDQTVDTPRLIRDLVGERYAPGPWTQIALARALDVSHPTLVRWLCSESRPATLERYHWLRAAWAQRGAWYLRYGLFGIVSRADPMPEHLLTETRPYLAHAVVSPAADGHVDVQGPITVAIPHAVLVVATRRYRGQMDLGDLAPGPTVFHIEVPS